MHQNFAILLNIVTRICCSLHPDKLLITRARCPQVVTVKYFIVNISSQEESWETVFHMHAAFLCVAATGEYKFAGGLNLR